MNFGCSAVNTARTKEWSERCFAALSMTKESVILNEVKDLSA